MGGAPRSPALIPLSLFIDSASEPVGVCASVLCEAGDGRLAGRAKSTRAAVFFFRTARNKPPSLTKIRTLALRTSQQSRGGTTHGSLHAKYAR